LKRIPGLSPLFCEYSPYPSKKSYQAGIGLSSLFRFPEQLENKKNEAGSGDINGDNAECRGLYFDGWRLRWYDRIFEKNGMANENEVIIEESNLGKNQGAEVHHRNYRPGLCGTSPGQ
jgi:hypothetical protein